MVEKSCLNLRTKVVPPIRDLRTEAQVMLRRLFIMWTFLLSASASAEDMQFDIGGGIQYFSGETGKSLATGTGYLLRFGADSGPGSFFRWIASFSLNSSAGSNTFSDNGTDVTLNYQFLAGEFDFGFKLSPLTNVSKLPVQPYLGAGGVAQAASFVFPKDSAVSATFPKTESSTLFGYTIFLGTDLKVGKDWGFQFHVEQAVISGTALKTTFSTGGNRFYFGVLVN